MFLYVLTCIFKENLRKTSKINKKVENLQNKVSWTVFGRAQHRKAGQNTPGIDGWMGKVKIKNGQHLNTGIFQNFYCLSKAGFQFAFYPWLC